MNKFTFEKEYRRLYLPLGMYALRMLEDVERSEDVVQDCFEKAWQTIRDGQSIDNFTAYMYTTVRNACISLLRTGHNEEKIDDSTQPVAEEEVDTSRRDARLWKAIDNLPPRCRETFLLGKRDGLSYIQIADRLGISVKTVENQMGKALRLIRDKASEIYRFFFCA